MEGIATRKHTLSLIEADTTARRLLDDLTPLCEAGKCTVAGSIRRREAEVGDIDIMCIPRVGKAVSPGEMFPFRQNLVIHYLTMQHHRRKGLKILKGGPRYQQFLYGTTRVDLFMPVPEQWGRMLAICTGPVSYAKEIAGRCNVLGYEAKDGALIHGNGNKPEFPTEKRFFKFLKWQYIKPEKRG
jgi:DNA polymerase/3'-5' exonuclease PolX